MAVDYNTQLIESTTAVVKAMIDKNFFPANWDQAKIDVLDALSRVRKELYKGLT